MMEKEYMELALKEAAKAYKNKEIPVGAVIVYQSRVIARAYNKRQKTKNVLAHAEILAIQKATKKLKDWRLTGCDMYVTLKPCSMCEKIINESRISNVYFLAEKQSFKKEYSKTEIKPVTDFDNFQKSEYLKQFKTFFEDKR